MITASGQFAITIGKRVMTVAGRLNIDLSAAGLSAIDFTRCSSSISLDDQLQTDLPAAARNTAGFATIGGQCTLAGRITVNNVRMSVADLFNPDNTASPLYRHTVMGAGVTFDIGVGRAQVPLEYVRWFTGVIVPGGSSLDHANGTVTLGLGDLTTKWTTVPSTIVPAIPPPFNANMTSEAVMDALIRSQEGRSSWLGPPPQCVLSVGFRTTLWPEIGTLPSSPYTPMFGPGATGSALLGGSTGGVITSYGLAMPPDNPYYGGIGQTFYKRFGVTGISAAGSASVQISQGVEFFSVQAVSTGILVGGTFGTAFWSVPIDSGPHWIEVTGLLPGPGSSGVSGTIWLDGVPHAFSFNNGTNRTSSTFNSGGFFVGTGVTLEGWQVGQVIASASSFPFTPIAVLDPSLNPITVPPPIDPDTLAFDELQRMAAAEFGYFRRDGSGIIRFSNRQTLAAQAIARTISSKVSLKTGLTTALAGADPYNHIQVPFTEWTFAHHADGSLKGSALFTLQSVKKIPTGTTTWTQPLDQGGANITTTATVLADGANPSDGGTYYRASLDRYGNGQHPGMSITVTPITTTTVQVTVVNQHQVGWLTTDTSYADLSAGQPGTGLWIGGVAVTASAEQLADATYGAADKKLTLDSNAYRQDADAALLDGYWMLRQLAVPIRDFESVEIVPDPRIETGDHDKIDDPDKSKISEYVAVWGRSFSASFPGAGQTGGTWAETLSCRALAAPGGWIGGIPGRSEGGITTYGYG